MPTQTDVSYELEILPWTLVQDGQPAEPAPVEAPLQDEGQRPALGWPPDREVGEALALLSAGEGTGTAATVASLGATGTPTVNRAGSPPRTTDTRVNPACINCSATRALEASSGQSQ
jgi:hypothetical protein